MRIGYTLYLWKILKPFEIKGFGKKSLHSNSIKITVENGLCDRVRTCGLVVPKPRITFFIALSNAF